MKSKKGLSHGDGWDDWMGQTQDFPSRESVCVLFNSDKMHVFQKKKFKCQNLTK